MDSRVVMMSVIGFAAVLIVKFIADAAVKYAQVERGDATSPEVQRLEARLDRLEHAIDAVAVEIERLGERQRFADQLAGARGVEQIKAPLSLGAPSDSAGRVITPH
jgi:outer membrane murein-binding lipoprotein Lpp